VQPSVIAWSTVLTAATRLDSESHVSLAYNWQNVSRKWRDSRMFEWRKLFAFYCRVFIDTVKILRAPKTLVFEKEFSLALVWRSSFLLSSGHTHWRSGMAESWFVKTITQADVC